LDQRGSEWERLVPHQSIVFIVKFWRTRQDSNLWPSPSEGDALSS
jgi:hypothetical protein